MVVDPSKEECSDYESDVSLSEEEYARQFSENMANGKKNLLCGDYSEAVMCFQTACSLQSDKYGDTSPECAEAFFYYGKALLELARVENNVLGNALKGVPETEDSDSDADDQFEKTKNVPAHIERDLGKVEELKEDERVQLRQDVVAAMATEEEEKEENEEAAERKDPSVAETSTDKGNVETKEKPASEAPESSVEEKKSEVEAQKRDSNAEKEDQSEGKASGDAGKPGDKIGTSEPSIPEGEKKASPDSDLEDESEEVSNLQLAWEMLELAKMMYHKKPKSDANSLMLAQCYLKVGELYLEVERYKVGIEDFLECLSIYEKLLTDNDRKLAEIHYNLGLVYSFDKQYDNSLKHYRLSLEVLERRIDHLNVAIDAKEDDAAVVDECTEVGEIKNLIPDVNAKIEDVLEMKKQEARMALLGESSSSFPSSSSNPSCTLKSFGEGGSSSSSNPSSTNDISHLVRRKRVVPESEQSSEIEMSKKKQKTDVSAPSTNQKSPFRNGKDSQAVKTDA